MRSKKPSSPEFVNLKMKKLLIFRFFARGEHFAPRREGAPCWNCEIREGVGNGDPYGNRTRVTAVKGRCPGPLDERVAEENKIRLLAKLSRNKSRPTPIFNRIFAAEKACKVEDSASISARRLFKFSSVAFVLRTFTRLQFCDAFRLAFVALASISNCFLRKSR